MFFRRNINMKYLLLSNSESISEIVNSDISSSNAANNMSTNDIISSYLEKVIHWCQTSGVKLLFGLIALFILFKIINAIAKKIRNKMLKKGRDETITNVMYEIVRKGLKILLFIFLPSFSFRLFALRIISNFSHIYNKKMYFDI